MNLNLIGGISFGILALFYTVYLVREYYFDFSKEKSEDFIFLPKGLLGLILLYIISGYCFYQFFQ
ncbi:hypothetical protein ABID46_000608 [Moheibacter stercoris]|uniref:Uncharacterized protein n=1 Tax=Moheibacter stercoris TaxID=1628251 RepID=A0ABV2LSH1_9FLAO